MADVYDFFLHNWVATVGMDTSWLTAINKSAQGIVTEARGLSPKPVRNITVRWDAIDQDEAHRLFTTIARAGTQRLRLPLYQDVSITTASSSGTTINAPTTSRRFVVGQRVVIHERVRNRPSNVQHRIVATVSAGSFTVTVALTGTYPAGSTVYPVMDVEIELGGGATALSDFVSVAQMSFSEVARTAPAASAVYSALTQDAFAAANGANYYLLDVGPNWIREVGYSSLRAGDAGPLGRDNVVSVRGPRPAYSFMFSYDAMTKAEFYSLLKFFDGHRGMLIPFFVANPVSVWNVENMGTTFVDVTRYGDIDDDGFASYLYLEMDDGTEYVREITAVANNGGLNRLSVTLPLLLAADVKRATTAHLCRFKSDTFHEEWLSDGLATVTIEVEESLGEEVLVTL